MAFLDVMPFDSSSSKQAYSRLPHGEDCGEPPSPTAKPAVQSFCSRYRFIFLAIVVCLLFVLCLPVIRYTELPDADLLQKWDQELEESANSTRIGPILGAAASANKFYFPPVGNDFRPHVAPYNYPPEERPRTPLFIPFTRNNDMLRQAVLGWIAAGWPREDIVLVDNTGTMDANNEGMLSPNNPFYMDYPLYRERYGVSIIQTSTLLNFAQLQNFLLHLAIAEKWPYFFWSHMDVGIVSDEAAVPYKSFYSRTLDVLHDATSPHPNPNITWSPRTSEMRNTTGTWAIKFFEFDNLSLINVAAWRRIGAWDTFIPYYNTDCDAYARILFHGHTKDSVTAGHIFDVADQIAHRLPDLEAAFFPAAQLRLNASAAAQQLSQYRAEVAAKHNPNMTAEHLFSDRPRLLDAADNRPNSPRFRRLERALRELQDRKLGAERNSWQDAQRGGRGEPWTYDPRGFQKAWWETAAYGRDLYTKKWGTLDCKLEGVQLGDAWKSEYPEEQAVQQQQPPPAEEVKVGGEEEQEGAPQVQRRATGVEKRWVQRASSGEWYLG